MPIMCLVLFVILLCRDVSAGILPRNEYLYSVDREWLVKNEENYPNKPLLNKVRNKLLDFHIFVFKIALTQANFLIISLG